MQGSLLAACCQQESGLLVFVLLRNWLCPTISCPFCLQKCQISPITASVIGLQAYVSNFFLLYLSTTQDPIFESQVIILSENWINCANCTYSSLVMIITLSWPTMNLSWPVLQWLCVRRKHCNLETNGTAIGWCPFTRVTHILWMYCAAGVVWWTTSKVSV